jgi:phage terminase large subunit
LVSFGIKRLAGLEEVVVDPVQCPAASREFSSYEYPSDGMGEFRAQFVDRNNHTIDAVRYALEVEMKAGKAGFLRVR